MGRIPTGRPPGRPRKPRPGDEGYVPPAQTLDAPKTEKPHAPKKRKTLQDFADEYDRGRRLYREAIESGSDQVPNLRAFNESILTEARLYGFSPESLVDRRSDADKITEAVDRLIVAREPTDEIERETLKFLEKQLADRVAMLDAQEASMSRAVQVVQEAEENRVGPLDRERIDRQRAAAREEGALRRGKAWLDILRRTIRLQTMAVEELPPPNTIKPFLKIWTKTPDPSPKRTEDCIRASHPLRHMAYVMRTNISERQKVGGPAEFFDFQDHHGQSAIAYYMMRTGTRIGPDGFYPFKPYEGLIVTMPPGLGKTSVGVAFFSLQIAMNPYTKIIVGHAIEALACKNVRYISSMFKADNPGGRRVRALYGAFEADKDNDHEFNLKLPKKSKESTIRGNSMSAKISGGDADWVWFDDPVDRSEREQENERRRKYEMMNENWLTRLRSNTAKHITTTTLWHEDDANCRRIRMTKAGQLALVVLVLAHGGPESPVPFKSLWPEEFPPSRLRQICARDPMSYSACYMSDPRTESMRIIRRLRYYDPASAEHARFMPTAVMHLSADPAATARQRSDRAGLVYAALGQVSNMNPDGSESFETRLRIITARQFHATQSDLSRAIAEFALSSRVDYCHVETVAAFVAMAEQLKSMYGIDCIQHNPGFKSKEIRLKSIAMLIDNSVRGTLSGGAVVEFPGAPAAGLGTCGPDPEYQWLYDQFTKFGITKEDHVVDAVTQLVGYLQRTGQLNPGAGWVSQQATVSAERSHAAGEIKRMLGLGFKPEASIEDSDFRFSSEMGNGY